MTRSTAGETVQLMHLALSCCDFFGFVQLTGFCVWSCVQLRSWGFQAPRPPRCSLVACPAPSKVSPLAGMWLAPRQLVRMQLTMRFKIQLTCSSLLPRSRWHRVLLGNRFLTLHLSRLESTELRPSSSLGALRYCNHSTLWRAWPWQRVRGLSIPSCYPLYTTTSLSLYSD